MYTRVRFHLRLAEHALHPTETAHREKDFLTCCSAAEKTQIYLEIYVSVPNYCRLIGACRRFVAGFHDSQSWQRLLRVLPSGLNLIGL